MAIHGTEEEEREAAGVPSLLLSTTYSNSERFQALITTLHVRRLPRIFIRMACNYQADT